MLKASKHLLLMLMRKIKLRSIYHPLSVNKTKCFMSNNSKNLWMRTQTFVMKYRSLLALLFKKCKKICFSPQRGRNWYLTPSFEAFPKLGARKPAWSQYAPMLKETVLITRINYRIAIWHDCGRRTDRYQDRRTPRPAPSH